MIATDSPFTDVPTHFNFTHDVVERWAALQPDALALWWIDEHATAERKLTFAELAHSARRAANFFTALNIRRGDHVLLIMARLPEWWSIMLGLIRLGAVPIPATPLLTAKDVAYRLKIAEISAVFADPAGAAKVDPAFTGTRILVGGDLPNWTRFETGHAAASDDAPFTPSLASDPGIIYFTSGTAGDAKMVLHSQISYGMGHTLTGKYWLDLRPGDMIWALADNGWAKTAWSNFYGP